MKWIRNFVLWRRARIPPDRATREVIATKHRREACRCDPTARAMKLVRDRWVVEGIGRDD